MGVKVLRPSGRKEWYIQGCEGGERCLRHAGGGEGDHLRSIPNALRTGEVAPYSTA